MIKITGIIWNPGGRRAAREAAAERLAKRELAALRGQYKNQDR